MYLTELELDRAVEYLAVACPCCAAEGPVIGAPSAQVTAHDLAERAVALTRAALIAEAASAPNPRASVNGWPGAVSTSPVC
jgi:hypothetical protein